MAGRGRPPTPVRLRLVTGAHRTTRHGNAAVAMKEAAGFGPLKAEKPQGACAGLLARHDRAGFMAGWVEEARHSVYSSQSISAGARAPDRMPASKLARMQALQGELGLTVVRVVKHRYVA